MSVHLCFLRPNCRMLSDAGKNCRTSSTMSIQRERNFRPQIKVIKHNIFLLFSTCTNVSACTHLFIFSQNFTVNWWQQRQRWITRTRRSRLYIVAWLKPWFPKRDWSRELWSLWKCPSTVCLMSHCRPGFRWVKNISVKRIVNLFEAKQHILRHAVFIRSFWMKTKNFRSRMRACRHRSPHRYI